MLELKKVTVAPPKSERAHICLPCFCLPIWEVDSK